MGRHPRPRPRVPSHVSGILAHLSHSYGKKVGFLWVYLAVKGTLNISRFLNILIQRLIFQKNHQKPIFYRFFKIMLRMEKNYFQKTMTNPCREFIQVFKPHFQFSVQPLVAEILMIKGSKTKREMNLHIF